MMNVLKLTFKQWKELGYHVKKGEHGVKNENNQVVFTEEQVEREEKREGSAWDIY